MFTPFGTLAHAKPHKIKFGENFIDLAVPAGINFTAL